MANYILNAAVKSGNLLIGYNIVQNWIPNSMLIFLLYLVIELIFYVYSKGLLLYFP